MPFDPVILVIYLGVLAICCVVGWYVMNKAQLGSPFREIILIAVVVVFAIIVIYFLLSFRHGVV